LNATGEAGLEPDMDRIDRADAFDPNDASARHLGRALEGAPPPAP
jgi:hypothetical protein